MRENGFIIPPRTVHSVVNLTGAPLVILTDYVVQSGQPLMQMVRR